MNKNSEIIVVSQFLKYTYSRKMFRINGIYVAIFKMILMLIVMNYIINDIIF